ncbi:MAG: hypothetical protein HQ483_07845 [Rhodospirillales bacterium]|nr:hypothetical protein [Rhodospirillales bacterium]
MNVISRLLHSMVFAVVVIGGLVVVAAALAFVFVGWLGIALVGLMGLYVSTRIDLNDGNAVADFDYGASSVRMLALQIEQQRLAGDHDRAQNAHDRRMRKTLIYLMNTVWLAMMALGFVMFTTHQL